MSTDSDFTPVLTVLLIKIEMLSGINDWHALKLRAVW